MCMYGHKGANQYMIQSSSVASENGIVILIYPRVKIWHNANTKNVFINLIDTLREEKRE